MPRAHGDLACLRHAGEPRGQLSDHFVLVCPQGVEIDFGWREFHTMARQGGGFIDNGGRVKQGLRGNAADIETYAAKRRPPLNQHRIQAEISRPECGRISPRPRAQNHQIAGDVCGTCERACRCCGDRYGCSRRGPCLASPCRGARCCRFQAGHQGALAHLVAHLHQQFHHLAPLRRRHLNGGLVAFQGDEGVLWFNDRAGRHMNFDNRHILEIADVGDADFNGIHGALLRFG